MLRRSIIVVVCLSIIMLITNTAIATEKKMMWKIGTFFHEEHSLTRAVFKFKEEMGKRVGDKVEIQVYPNMQLGGGREMVEGVQLGTIQACEASLAWVANFDKSFLALNLPYLFVNRKIAFEFLDGPVGILMGQNLEKSGIHLMGYFENGIRHVTNNKRPIHKPGDLKGLKIRTMENPVHLAAFRNFGAMPTPMAFGEVFTALQQGVIDGQENPLANIDAMKFYEVQKYLSLTAHFYDVTGFMINSELYHGLPDDIRKAVDECATIAVQVQRQYAVEDDERFLKKFQEQNLMTINDLTNEERMAFKEAGMPTYDEFAGQIGSNLLNQIMEEVKKLEATYSGDK